MNSRAIIMIFILAIVASACLAGPNGGPAAKPDSAAFPEWGFSLEIPKPFEEFVLPAQGDTLLSKLFICDQNAYWVQVSRTPAKTVLSTFIEKSIQNEINLAPAGSTRRWEGSTLSGVFFKGITKPYKTDDQTDKFLKKVLDTKANVSCLAILPTGDDTAPILRVTVIAPDKLKGQAQTKALVLATTIKKIAAVKPTGYIPPNNPAPKAVVSQSGRNPRGRPSAPRSPIDTTDTNLPTINPLPNDIKPSITQPKPKVAIVRPLNKGEIELIGNIEAFVANGKGFSLLVEEVRMPGMKLTELDPARSKTVLFDNLPPGIVEGARIVIIGRNSGVGAPIKADVLEKIEEVFSGRLVSSDRSR